MWWTTPKANVPSTTPPSYDGPPADGRDEIIGTPDYNGEAVTEEETQNPEPMDIAKHRNRRLINSKVCGMSCEKQKSCKKLEKVLSFFEEALINLNFVSIKSFDLFHYLHKTINF